MGLCSGGCNCVINANSPLSVSGQGTVTDPYVLNSSISGGDATTLNGQSGTYYLDRANHTGTQLSTTISDFNEASQDAIGLMVTDTPTIDLVYTDATPALTANIVVDSVDNTFLANMAQSTIKGRAAGAGTGDPTDLTAAQVKTILGYIAESLIDAKGDLIVGTANDTASRLGVGTDGQVVIASAAAAPGVKWASAERILGFVLDGGGSAITTGAKKAYVSVPIDCTITKWRLLADIAGSIVLDIWKSTFAGFPPTALDIITPGAKPTLVAAIKDESTTLTGWTTSLTAGDILEINVDSATTVTKVYLHLSVIPR